MGVLTPRALTLYILTTGSICSYVKKKNRIKMACLSCSAVTRTSVGPIENILIDKVTGDCYRHGQNFHNILGKTKAKNTPLHMFEDNCLLIWMLFCTYYLIFLFKCSAIFRILRDPGSLFPYDLVTLSFSFVLNLVCLVSLFNSLCLETYVPALIRVSLLE